jgi:hypothetical protein
VSRYYGCLDEEPKYHFELQATEEGLGVVKVDAAMHPVYNLGMLMQRLKDGFARLWTPQLCFDLVQRRCREMEMLFFAEDVKKYGPGGRKEAHECASAHCTITQFQHAAAGPGAKSRAIELRKCSGDCGQYFHADCLVKNRKIDSEARAIMWPVDGENCQCGCASGSDDSSGGDSDSESAEIGEAEVRKRQLNKAVEVYRSSVRDLIEQEEAEAARKKAKSAGGAAKSTNARL